MYRIPIAVGECYHVYNRGVDKRVIFETPYDYERFKLLILLSNSVEEFQFPVSFNRRAKSLEELLPYWEERGEPLVAISSWCLMPNHFHFVVKQLRDGGVSLFMRKLCTAYAMYFNMTRDRTGPLFSGRFKVKHIDDDVYMRHLMAYVHMNPMKTKYTKWKEKIGTRGFCEKHLPFVTQFPHSSAYEYTKDARTRDRKEALLIDKKQFPNYGVFMEHERELVKWFDPEM